MLALIISAALAMALAFFTRRAIVRLSDGEDHLDWTWALLPPFLGALVMATAAPGELLSSETLNLIMIGAILLGLAASDRQTAWAPDEYTYPLAALAGSQLFLVLGYPVLLGIVAGIGFYVALNAAFVLAYYSGCKMPPPADLLAFAVGPALLGIGAHLASALVAIAFLLLIARVNPSLNTFYDPKVIEKASRDLGYDESMGPAIPLLPIILPIYFISLLAMTLQNGMPVFP